MSVTVSKEQVLAKMQEFDASLQAVIAATQVAVRMRTELWSMIADLPEDVELAEVQVPLTFYENGHVIAWGDDSEHFRPSTFRLVQQLWQAAERTLSKEDVRQDTIFDEDAKPESLRTLIKNARRELEAVYFPYEIETLWGKGYRLKACSQQ